MVAILPKHPVSYLIITPSHAYLEVSLKDSYFCTFRLPLNYKICSQLANMRLRSGEQYTYLYKYKIQIYFKSKLKSNYFPLTYMFFLLLMYISTHPSFCPSILIPTTLFLHTAYQRQVISARLALSFLP
jgi:hypothetical protein